MTEEKKVKTKKIVKEKKNKKIIKEVKKEVIKQKVKEEKAPLISQRPKPDWYFGGKGFEGRKRRYG